MDTAAGLHYDDSMRPASQENSDSGPTSRQQSHQQRRAPSETGHNVEGRAPNTNVMEEQVPRTTSRRPGARGLSGPTATLFSLAFRQWGEQREDRRPGDERESLRPHRRDNNSRAGSRRPRPPLALTRDMCATYSTCNQLFRFTPNIPRRILTNPSTAAGNNGLDNAEFNLIARVNDILESPTTSYCVLDLLGQGTFGQVFRCQDHSTREIKAVKVIKNKPAYRTQAMVEIQVAKLLNERYDPHDTKNIVRLQDCFQFHNHLCLVFELLGYNLYELLKQNQFRGQPLSNIRHFIKQILEALEALEQANVIHCDLKPENVLLMNKNSGEDLINIGTKGGRGGDITGSGDANAGVTNVTHPGAGNRLKVIDFGSACFEGQTMYSYIQSRFYRSPEVLLGLPYDGAIDIWSLGCIAVELFLGLPIFPGVSDHNQISRIVEMMGSLPTFMLENGKDTLKFFKRVPVTDDQADDSGRNWRAGGVERASDPYLQRENASAGRRTTRARGYRHVLKTPEEYAQDTNTSVPELRKYFKPRNIPDIIQSYPLPPQLRRAGGSGSGGGIHSREAAQEKEARRVFTHFVLGLLDLNPWTRWTPKQAASHPFVTGQPHPRDLGALTIADDPLVGSRASRYRQAMHAQQQEAERQHAHRARHQQRERGRGLAIPGRSHARGTSISSTSATTSGSMNSHAQYHASPSHARRSSGDVGVMAMQVARTPQGIYSTSGDDGGRLEPISRPIDVPSDSSGTRVADTFLRGAFAGARDSHHELTARSMGGYPVGGGGTSYPPPASGADDDAELDRGAPEAYSYSAASFSLGGSTGNYVASDFGYALQRPGIRYEAVYGQNSPSTTDHVNYGGGGGGGGGSLRVGRYGTLGSQGPGMTHRASFTGYHQQARERARGHERGGRAMSMDQSVTPLNFYVGGAGGQLPGMTGGFGGPPSLRYTSQQQSLGPPGYTSSGGSTFLLPTSGFRRDETQVSMPWNHARPGPGHGSDGATSSPRAQSTSPPLGRALPTEIPTPNSSAHPHERSMMDEVPIMRNSVGGNSSMMDAWEGRSNHHAGGGGLEPDDLAQRSHRRHRMSGNLGIDPDSHTSTAAFPFAFQVDDGRGHGGNHSMVGQMGGAGLASDLDWIGSAEDPEGVHKRSLNGTSKGSLGGGGSGLSSASSPRGDSDLIRRVACSDSPIGPPPTLQQSGSLLSQQLQQYEQQHVQGQAPHRSPTPLGRGAAASASDLSPGAISSHHHHPRLDCSSGRSSDERWTSSRSGHDDGSIDHAAIRGTPGSAWVSSSSTRALRRRASAESCEFYFVDTLQQSGSSSGGNGGGGGATGRERNMYIPPPVSPAGASSGRSLYPGISRSQQSSGGTPLGFQHQQQHPSPQGYWPVPPRPPRNLDGTPSSGTLDNPSWSATATAGGSESSWNSRSSPMLSQHLPPTPRSLGIRGSGSWDDRSGPDIMHSIHEGNPSTEN